MEKQQTKNISGFLRDFNNEEGVGTIVSTDNEEFIFTYEDLPTEDGKFLVPALGEKLVFDIEKTDLGWVAKNIRLKKDLE